jgi:hypothetical protein
VNLSENAMNKLSTSISWSEFDAENLEDFLSSNSENSYLELKQTYDKGSIQKTCNAFANSDGGILIIGVEDDGRIIGCSTPNRKEEPQSDIHDILSNFSPYSPKHEVKTLKLDDNLIVMINIFPSSSNNKPYLIQSNGKCYGFNRVNNQSIPLKQPEIREMILDSANPQLRFLPETLEFSPLIGKGKIDLINISESWAFEVCAEIRDIDGYTMPFRMSLPSVLKPRETAQINLWALPKTEDFIAASYSKFDILYQNKTQNNLFVQSLEFHAGVDLTVKNEEKLVLSIKEKEIQQLSISDFLPSDFKDKDLKELWFSKQEFLLTGSTPFLRACQKLAEKK